MLHVFQCVPLNRSIHFFLKNIFKYVQISQLIMVYFFLKNHFNNMYSIYIKQYYYNIVI